MRTDRGLGAPQPSASAARFVVVDAEHLASRDVEFDITRHPAMQFDTEKCNLHQPCDSSIDDADRCCRNDAATTAAAATTTVVVVVKS